MPFFGTGGGAAAFNPYTTISGSTVGLTNCLANLDVLNLGDFVTGDRYNQKDPNAIIKVAKFPNLGIGGSKYDWVQPIRGQALTLQSNQINSHAALLSNGYDSWMRFLPAGMDLFNNLNGLVLFYLYKQAVNTATITSITGNGTTMTVTCSAPLDQTVWFKNKQFTITGNANGGFNVTNQTIASVSGSTFTASNATNATAAGGTVTQWGGDSGLIYTNCATGTTQRFYMFTHANGVGLGTLDFQLRRSDTDSLVSQSNSGSLTHYPLGSWNLAMITLDYSINTNNLKYYNLVGGTGSGISNTSITTPLLTQSEFTGAATATDATNSAIARTTSSYLDANGNGGIQLCKLGGAFANTGKQSFDGLVGGVGILRLTGSNNIGNSTTIIRACAAELKTWSGL